MYNLFLIEGLCNETRLVMTRLGRKAIEACILGSDFDGQVRLIPRIKLTTKATGLPYDISRTQLPVRLCFAMTINKSQGQSFEHVGIDLREPVFAYS